ncbi:YkvA family protein [Streptomyces xinghaiensis]|uniref:YkvA family protein n=1 Tax=Streptomyces xinghaiensis TaxID=1038928 RepID=UPI00030E9F4C
MIDQLGGPVFWVLVVLAVAMLAVAVVLAVKLVRTYRMLRSEDTPAGDKLLFWGAIVYTVFPVDLLPDPIYLDDIGLLLGALHHLGKAAAKRGTDARTPAPRDGDHTPPARPAKRL